MNAATSGRWRRPRNLYPWWKRLSMVRRRIEARAVCGTDTGRVDPGLNCLFRREVCDAHIVDGGPADSFIRGFAACAGFGKAQWGGGPPGGAGKRLESRGAEQGRGSAESVVGGIARVCRLRWHALQQEGIPAEHAA